MSGASAGAGVAEALRRLLDPGILDRVLEIGVLSLAAVLGFKALEFGLRRLLKGRVKEGSLLLLRKGMRYASFAAIVLILFNRLGIDITALLGAAGIAGIAVGFAAQTSVSNVISGLFILSEKSFSAGDVITAGEVTGTVLSIDLLSVKLQTFDNRFVRIPNETIIKSNVVNVTRYPIRRMDLNLLVSYEDELGEVLEVLRRLAADNLLVLDRPEPLVMVDRLEEGGILVLLGLWYLQADYLELRNGILVELRRSFAARGFRPPATRILLAEPRPAEATPLLAREGPSR